MKRALRVLVTNQSQGGAAPAPPINPAVRGSNIQSSSAAAYTIPIPAGTLAGDLAIIFYGGAYQALTIGGLATWTVVDYQTGPFFNGSTFSKILTSGDVAAGNVVVTASGTFDAVCGMVTFIGGTGGVSQIVSARYGLSPPTSVPLTLGSSSPSTDTLLYFGSTRSDVFPTVSVGSVLQQSADGSAAAASIYSKALTSSGVQSATFGYDAGSSGNYSIIVDVAAA